MLAPNKRGAVILSMHIFRVRMLLCPVRVISNFMIIISIFEHVSKSWQGLTEFINHPAEEHINLQELPLKQSFRKHYIRSSWTIKLRHISRYTFPVCLITCYYHAMIEAGSVSVLCFNCQAHPLSHLPIRLSLKTQHAMGVLYMPYMG